MRQEVACAEPVGLLLSVEKPCPHMPACCVQASGVSERFNLLGGLVEKISKPLVDERIVKGWLVLTNQVVFIGTCSLETRRVSKHDGDVVKVGALQMEPTECHF